MFRMPQFDPDNLPDDHDFDGDGNIVNADGTVVADPEGKPVAGETDDFKHVRAAANRSNKNAKKAEEAETRAAKAERELALIRAGVPLASQDPTEQARAQM